MSADLRRDPPAPGPIVRGYARGGFTVDGETHRAVLLTPERAVAWNPPPLADLAVAHLEPVLGLEPAPDFLILGTGSTQAFPPRALVRAFEERGMGIEAMDSRAAARTWGILRAEQRWIAAALLPLEK